jgi:hypothetical protein
MNRRPHESKARRAGDQVADSERRSGAARHILKVMTMRLMVAFEQPPAT